MNAQSKKLVAALLLPIATLMLLAVYKGIKVSIGKTVVIPISGYDPRDVLAGHYLTYQVDYNCPGLCSDEGSPNAEYICVRQLQGNQVESQVVSSPDEAIEEGCDAVIRGSCGKWGRFEAGIERFYIPEKKSELLDSIARERKGKIVVRVDGRGNATIRDLLINDRSWKEYRGK